MPATFTENLRSVAHCDRSLSGIAVAGIVAVVVAVAGIAVAVAGIAVVGIAAVVDVAPL